MAICLTSPHGPIGPVVTCATASGFAGMPPIVIDTREQRPYAFPGAVPGALPTGDYSLLGYEDQVAVERKSKSDAYSSLGRDRARFRREAERLGAMPFGAIVVEAGTVDFLRPPPFSQLAPTAALHSLLSWSVRFRLPVFFADGREHGAMITLQLLHKFWYHHGEGARG